jgi:penicillin V acylase-like amidase (Ntn superfamily)
MYIFPAGLQRNASVGENSMSWISKYGSMVTTMYDMVSIDGMNSEGLTGSLLYLGNSDYGARNASRPGLPIGFWLQHFLDLYPNVAAAAEALQKDNIQVVTKALVPGVSSTAHLALSDKSGDNMIVEYLNGKMVIHHGQEYPVMTNDPSFDDQLTLNTYWTPISNVSLPGTGSPAGEF